MATEKMTKAEYEQYTLIKKERQLTMKNQEFLATMHARIFNHDKYIPCSCSPKVWQEWIGQLNTIYEDGYKDNTRT